MGVDAETEEDGLKNPPPPTPLSRDSGIPPLAPLALSLPPLQNLIHPEIPLVFLP